jgi:predicted transcriptional regulator of viral defense system
MDSKFQLIKQIASYSEGVITTRQIEEAGLSRTIIKNYVDQEMLIRESQGVYTLSSEIVDNYKLLQKRSEKIIFSYGTALYLHGMSDKVPHILDVTVPQGYNVTRIKKDHPNIRFHYVKKELWNLGIVKVQTPMGVEVLAYDKERCICDLISKKNDMDMQLYIQAIKEYFNSDANIRKILKYGKTFGIEDMIRSYMEVLI